MLASVVTSQDQRDDFIRVALGMHAAPRGFIMSNWGKCLLRDSCFNVWDFLRGSEVLWSHGPAKDTRLSNRSWPVQLCLGGALRLHHPAVRGCCVCAGPHGSINACVWRQVGLLPRMCFGACFHLWIFVCELEQSVFMCVCACVRVPVSVWTCVSVSFSAGLWSRRLARPGVTFSHEAAACDTSSGLGQTSPDPSSNTPGWSPSVPRVPFSHSYCHLTAAPSLLSALQSPPHRAPSAPSGPANSWAQPLLC